MNEREIAKNIVRQWDNHERFRSIQGEDNMEPDSVKVARALLRVDAEYGCEVQDPCGTIWEHAANMRAKAINVLEWYYRDGSVGGACDPMEALREAVGVTEEWLLRK